MVQRGDKVYIVIYTHTGGVDFSVWPTWQEATDAAMETMRLFVESIVQGTTDHPVFAEYPPALEKLSEELDADRFPSALREWEKFQHQSGIDEKLWVEETKVR